MAGAIETPELGSELKALLESKFGHKKFLPLQAEVIRNVLDGRDSLALMPTGSGKSLCYQLPALCLDGVTLVISPLIALMKDQVDALQSRGIAADCINSTMSAAHMRRVQVAAYKGPRYPIRCSRARSKPQISRLSPRREAQPHCHR